jgi:hypothetical protein
MKIETKAVAPERVGRDDVGTRLEVSHMNGKNSFRILRVEAFRRVAGLQPGGLEHGSHGAVSHKNALSIQPFLI